jgi:MFS family permease
MDPRKHTTAYFVLEGVNSFGTTLYFYYLYFFTEQQFGFTKFHNLLLAAGLGLTYGLSSIVAGRFAQQRGYVTALKGGYAIMAVAIGVGAFVSALPVHLVIMFVSVSGMALTWPALEALVSEGRSRGELQRNVGIYNLVWGGFGALAYFSGGAIFKAAGFRAMFLVPAAIHLLQWMAVLLLERGSARRNILAALPKRDSMTEGAKGTPHPGEDGHEKLPSPARAKAFLRMAWLANPFGYLAINSVIAVMPAVANRLQLTVAQAGIFCSVWLFVRTASFGLLWLWPGWHYRFRWLVAAYAMMTVGFITLLLASNLWLVVVAQVLFGFALGLIYYSSLYYSMDVGETKGEHGGLHEAMIGAGSFAGPAIGAVGACFFPAAVNASTWTPAALLLCGFIALLWSRLRTKL